VRAGLLATACTLVLALWRLARAPAARWLRAAPLVVPGCAFLALVVADLAHAWHRGFLGSDPVDQALWTGQAVALLGLAVGVAWLLAVARRRRSRLARVVLELVDAQRPGGLREALAELLGDPELELLYAGTAGGWIDAAGQVREPLPDASTTELVRDGHPVALLCHRPGLLDDRRLAAEIERGVRLGLEHERLQSLLRHQLEELRGSRADVVAAGEAERRLLERDLHDGAQQRLVAFAFALGIARQRVAPERSAALAGAQREVQAALAELRELAHGLYPVALADAGLAVAIESLKDRRPGLRTNRLPAGRFLPAIEETAYFAIARLADHWEPQPLTLAAARDGQRLIIDLHAQARPPADLVDVEDRVGALDGTLVVKEKSSDDTHVRVELPCA
jgi:signal transduction histidine kinase